MKKHLLPFAFFVGLFTVSCGAPSPASPSSDTSSTSEGSSFAPSSESMEPSSDPTPHSSKMDDSSESAFSSSPTSSATSSAEADFVVVFCETYWTNVWAWDSGGNFFDAWPGAALMNYDADWKTYRFDDKASFNIIFSKDNGKTQTADLTITAKGNWWFYQNQWYRENPRGGSDISSSVPSSEVDIDATKRILESDGYQVQKGSMSMVPSDVYAETQLVKEGLSAHKTGGFFFAFFCYSAADANTFRSANDNFSTHSEGVASGVYGNVAWVGMETTAKLLGWIG